MDTTRDPSISPDLFSEYTAQFFEVYTIPPFTNPEEAVGLVYIMDTLVDAITDTMKKQNLLYTPETILIFGSPLGEALRMIFSADWVFSERQDRWVLAFTLPNNDRVELNPFNKLEKRIENGMEDSINYWLQSSVKTFTQGL